MKDVLEPLARVSGVRVAMLTSPDGFPIAIRGRGRSESAHDESPAFGDSTEDLNALAGLAAGWFSELGRAVSPLAWGTPRRVVLRATRGTMVLLEAQDAVLLVLLQSGVQAEELRLPMDAALNRMQRVLRGMGRASEAAHVEEQPEPMGLFPGQPNAAPGESCDHLSSGNPVPETTGEV